jgi:hypothetical protein
MALSDWTIYKNIAGLQVSIETSTPIVDDGSLHLQNVGISTGTHQFINLTNNDYVKGKSRGRIRTLLNFKATPAPATDRTFAGINFLSAALDMSPGTPNTYAFSAFSDFSGGVRTFRLSRWSIAGPLGSEVTLHTVAHPAFTFGTPFALEVEWHLDVAALGGVRIILRKGTALDFSDLVQIYDAVDPSLAITSTASEGVYLFRFGSGGNPFDVLFDKTAIFSVS